MTVPFKGTILRQRRPLIVAIQLGLVVFANWFAFSLRFDGQIPNWAWQAFLGMLPWLVAIRALTFIPFRLYEGLWRYSSIWDLRNIVLAVGLSTVLFKVFTLTPLGPPVYPRAIFVVDPLILVIALGGLRMARRFYRELVQAERDKRVLVYGAGDAGESLVRDMKNRTSYEYEPVGFVDDDPSKQGLRIHGVPVLGGRSDLQEIIRRTNPHEVVIAMPSADAAIVRDVVTLLEPFKLRITTLPNLSDIIDGRVTVSHIRTLEVEDLLNRAPVGLDPAPVRHLIKDRRVMVTGAGGSIGSELCRQIASFNPASLVLYERYENNLYAIVNDLKDSRGARRIVPAIGDVTDRARLADVLGTHKPEIIFHAAAHKHVPLMEENPCEAVKNNVYGTRLLAEMAERHGVDRFIFISTDKAVNPTSIMGASKRIAELVVHAQAQGSGTSFFTVRFGNVLGSNGSVVPRFVQQIIRGGPVTITHPEMRRFFMSIPEAVQLVLHAAAQGRSGETYVLEMGEQVKVVDMARNLIRLSGFKPDVEIPIQFVGLRPGEKLFEELVGEDEVVSPSGIENVNQVRQRRVPTPESLKEEVVTLETLAWDGRRQDLLRQIASLLPDYGPNVAIERPASKLSYTGADIDAESEPDNQLDTAFVQICPACRSSSVHRSRTRSMAEKIKKAITQDRLFRCHDCGWRGWMTPVAHAASTPVDGNPAAAPDLRSLDAAADVQPAAARAAFSPRNLK